MRTWFVFPRCFYFWFQVVMAVASGIGAYFTTPFFLIDTTVAVMFAIIIWKKEHDLLKLEEEIDRILKCQ